MSFTDAAILTTIAVAAVIFVVSARRFLRYGQYKKVYEKSRAHEDLIEQLDGSADGIEKIKELMPEFQAIDLSLKKFGDNSAPLEIFAKRTIACLQYNDLCKKINGLHDNPFLDDQMLKNLLPECIAADSAMKDAHRGDEMPKEFMSLEHFIRAQLASGDIDTMAYV